MDKDDVVHIYKHNKEKNNGICSNMDEPKDYHSKQSKLERESKIHMISLICGL